MARFPTQQGKGSAGGTGSVEKLAENITTDNLQTSLTATISPAVNFADYAEFWLIIDGILTTVTSDDCFVEINQNTSTNYNVHGLFTTSTTNQRFNVGGASWRLNPSSPMDNGQAFYFKLVLSGGTQLGANFERKGTLSGACTTIPDGQVSVFAYVSQSDLTIGTTLTEFRVFTGGTSPFDIGTKVTVYGVKTA